MQGQHIEKSIKHEPESGHDRQKNPQVGFHEFGQGLRDQVALLYLTGRHFALMLEPLFKVGLLVHEKKQEIDGNNGCAGEEKVGPGELPELCGQQWTHPPADIDGLVKDAPRHGTVLAVCRLDQRSLDSGFEYSGPRGQHDGAHDEPRIGGVIGHDQVGENLYDRRQKDRFLVTEAIRQATHQDRDDRLEKRPDQEDRTEFLRRHTQPAF